MEKTPVEIVLERYKGDIFGHNGFLSLESNFFARHPLPTSLPPDWLVWEEYVAQIPKWYREGKVCEHLLKLPFIDPENLGDEYLVRANMIMGFFALGFVFCWEQMHEGRRLAVQNIVKGSFTKREEILELIRKSVLDPWEKIWRCMGRHRSCFEADVFSGNFKYQGDKPYVSHLITGDNSRLYLPFFATRTEHRFWFSVLELCSKFTGVSLTVKLQRGMIENNHKDVAATLFELADLWNNIVEEALIASDTRVSAIDWGNTTARWTSALFQGEEGFSGMFAPAWHVMDMLMRRSSYSSFLGKVMLRTREMFPIAWREYIEAVGKISLQDYIDTHKAKNPELEKGYKAVKEAYQYFFASHRRKVYAFEYQAILSGRAATNAGLISSEGVPGWDIVDMQLKQSSQERPHTPRQVNPEEVPELPVKQLSPRLISLPVSNDLWFPGDRGLLNIEQDNGQQEIIAYLAPSIKDDEHPLFWSTEFRNPKKARLLGRIPSEFFRPPRTPTAAIILTDNTCIGMATAIANHRNVLQPLIGIEAEESLESEIKTLMIKPYSFELTKNIDSFMTKRWQEIFRLIMQDKAHLYISGKPNFIKRALQKLREILSQETAFVDGTLRLLREEKRLHLRGHHEKNPQPLLLQQLYPWDVATATNPVRCARVVLHSHVLNITDFLSLHPGGENILEMLMGTDISREFEVAHPYGEQFLGIPQVFIEGEYVAPSEKQQAIVHLLYKMVRYVNAFVVTMNDVKRDHSFDIYVCANTLLQALNLWPCPLMWGEALFQTLRIPEYQTQNITELCNNIHKEVIDIIQGDMMSDEGLDRFRLRDTQIISDFEDFGRSIIIILAEMIEEIYEEDVEVLTEELKLYFLEEMKEAVHTYLTSLLMRLKPISYFECRIEGRS